MARYWERDPEIAVTEEMEEMLRRQAAQKKLAPQIVQPVAPVAPQAPVAPVATTPQQQAAIPSTFDPQSSFNPEGPGYDYASAKAAGLGPDEQGKWPDRDPRTGLILRGKEHSGFYQQDLAPQRVDITDKGPSVSFQNGTEISKGADGRYYVKPIEDKETPSEDEEVAGDKPIEAAGDNWYQKDAEVVGMAREDEIRAWKGYYRENDGRYKELLRSKEKAEAKRPAEKPRDEEYHDFRESIKDLSPKEKKLAWEKHIEKMAKADETRGRVAVGAWDAITETSTWKDAIPIIPTVVSIFEWEKLRRASSAYEEGTATAKEEALRTIAAEKLDMEYARDPSLGHQITKGVTGLSGFMGEMLMGGPIAAAAKLKTVAPVLKILGKYGSKSAGKIIAKIAEIASGAAARTVTTGAPKVIAGAAERMTAKYSMASGELKKIEEAEGAIKSTLKSFGDVFIEYFSEDTGEALGKVFGLAFRRASKVIPEGVRKKFQEKGLARLIQKAKDVGWVGKTNDILKAARYDGPLPEWLEERFGTFLRVITGVDDREIPASQKFFEAMWPGKRQAIVELGVLSFPAGVMGAVNVVGSAPRRRQDALNEALPNWVEQNPESAKELADIENPTRAQWPNGLPKMSSNERAGVSALLKTAFDAEKTQETEDKIPGVFYPAKKETVVPEKQEAPVTGITATEKVDKVEKEAPQKRTTEEVNKLVTDNAGLANKIASGYKIPGMDTNDIKQQANLLLKDAAETYDESKGEFKTWAGTIIRSKLKTLYTKQQKTVGKELSIDKTEGEDDIPMVEKLAAPEVADKMGADEKAILDEAVKALPEQQRKIVQGFFAERTDVEMAKEFGISKQAVNKQREKAFKTLKEQMKAKGIKPSAVISEISDVPTERRFDPKQIQEAFPGSKVTKHEDGKGFKVELPNGKTFTVKVSEDIPVSVNDLMSAYGVSRQTAEGMVIKGVMVPKGVEITLADGTKMTAEDVMVIIDPKRADNTTARHEALHVAVELGLFETEEGKKLWNTLEKEYGNEENIAAARGEWNKPDGLWTKIRDFIRNFMAKIGFEMDAEMALSKTFAEDFWAQAEGGVERTGLAYQAAEESMKEKAEKYKFEIEEIRQEIERSVAGKREPNPAAEGGFNYEPRFIGIQSTFPEFFRTAGLGKKWTKVYARDTIAKVQGGDFKLQHREQHFVDSLFAEAESRKIRMEEEIETQDIKERTVEVEAVDLGLRKGDKVSLNTEYERGVFEVTDASGDDIVLTRGNTEITVNQSFGVLNVITDDVKQLEKDVLTGISKDKVAELREQIGLEPIEGVDAETWKMWVGHALETLAGDKDASDRLVNELAKNPRVVSEREAALLAIHKRSIYNEYEIVTQQLFEASEIDDYVRAAILNPNVIDLQTKINNVDAVLDRVGTSAGRSLNALKIMFARDNSFEGLSRKARAEQGGKELSTEQLDEMRNDAKKIADLEKKVAELEAKETGSKKSAKGIIKEDIVAKKKKRIYKPTKEQATVNQKEAKVLDRFKKAFGDNFNDIPFVKAAIKAQAVLVEGQEGKRPSKKVEITDEQREVAREMAEFYAKEKGVISFGEFWAHAKLYIKENAEQYESSFREAWNEIESGPDFIAPDLSVANPGQITRAARAIVTRLVEGGMTDINQIIDSVQEAMSDVLKDKKSTIDAISGYGQFTRPNQSEVSQKVRDINAQLLQLSKLEQLEEAKKRAEQLLKEGVSEDKIREILIKENLNLKPTGFLRDEPSNIVRHMTALVNAAKREMPISTKSTEEQLQTAQDAVKSGLNNRIFDLKEALRLRKEMIKKPSQIVKDAEIKRLQEEVDSLMKSYRLMFPPEGATEAQKNAAALKAITMAVNEVERQVKESDLEIKAPAKKRSTAEINAQRERLESWKKIRDILRDESGITEKRARLQHEANLRKRLAEVRDFIAQGDFAPKPKKEPRQFTKAELKLKKEIEDAKKAARQHIEDYRIANLSPLGKVGHWTKEIVLFAPRTIKASFDISGLRRQGGIVAVSHPDIAVKAATQMMKALFSEQAHFESAEEIRNHPQGHFAKMAGLAITEANGEIKNREEEYRGSIAEYIPGVKASERAYVTVLNNMRFGLFVQMVENLGRDGRVTLAEAKVIASYINAATGRSDLKALNKWTENLNNIFWATRWVASRFQYVAMPFYLPFTKASPRVKMAIAKEYVRTITGLGVYTSILLGLAYLNADDDDEKPTMEIGWDSSWLATNFARIKIGETYIDTTSGIAPTLVFLARMFPWRIEIGGTVITGAIKTGKGEIKEFGEGFKPTTQLGLLGKFLRYKLAPVTGAGLTFFDRQEHDDSGVKYMTDAVGQKVTPVEFVLGLYEPLSVMEVFESMKHHKFSTGSFLSLLSQFGESINTYGPKTEYTVATDEEREEIFEKDLKKIQWSDPRLAYSEFLSPEQMQAVDKAKQLNAGKRVYQATKERPDYKEKAERIERASEKEYKGIKEEQEAIYKKIKKLPPASQQRALEKWKEKNKELIGKLRKETENALRENKEKSKERIEKWVDEKAKARSLLKGFPDANKKMAFDEYWSSAGKKIGSTSYYEHLRMLNEQMGDVKARKATPEEYVEKSRFTDASAYQRSKLYEKDLKKIQWDDEDPAYFDMLSPKHKKSVRIAKQRNAGYRVHQLTASKPEIKKFTKDEKSTLKKLIKDGKKKKAQTYSDWLKKRNKAKNIEATQKWKEKRTKAFSLINELPPKHRKKAFDTYWKSRGRKIGSDSYYRHLRILEGQLGNKEARSLSADDYIDKNRMEDASAKDRVKLFKKDLKNIQWDDDALAYEDMLSKKQKEAVRMRRQRNAGLRVYQMTTSKPKAPKIKDRNKESLKKYSAKVAKWKKDSKTAYEKIKDLPREDRKRALDIYWKSRGYKANSKSYRKRLKFLEKLPF